MDYLAENVNFETAEYFLEKINAKFKLLVKFPLYEKDKFLDVMQYRRAKTPGATYFFTVVTYQRQKLFHDPKIVDLLRQSFRFIKQRHPFTIKAIAILPSSTLYLDTAVRRCKLFDPLAVAQK